MEIASFANEFIFVNIVLKLKQILYSTISIFLRVFFYLLNEDEMIEQICSQAMLQISDFGFGAQVAALTDHRAVRSHRRGRSSRFILKQIKFKIHSAIKNCFLRMPGFFLLLKLTAL